VKLLHWAIGDSLNKSLEAQNKMGMLNRRSVSVFMLFGLGSLAICQEPQMDAPTRPGGRGRANTREFLGLGPAPDQAAAKLGDPIYKQNCGTCHGENGRGSQGPNLVRSTVVLHDEKGEEIGPVIKNGRPQSGMPAFPALSKDDLYNISQYLHLQVELAANRGLYGQTYSNQRSQTTGDAKKGQAFFQSNCASCHALEGTFAKIGTKYAQAAAMQSRFLWPTPQGPRHATVTTPSGQTIEGNIVKYDDFFISLRTAKGDFHEWPLAEVKVQIEDKLSGHRALLPKYTDADIHNTTAYLVTLK
jgi:cytochrome c oxidase cbb3-type subunit III